MNIDKLPDEKTDGEGRHEEIAVDESSRRLQSPQNYYRPLNRMKNHGNRYVSYRRWASLSFSMTLVAVIFSVAEN